METRIQLLEQRDLWIRRGPSLGTRLGRFRWRRGRNVGWLWPGGGAVDVLLRPDDIVYAPDSALKARIVEQY